MASGFHFFPKPCIFHFALHHSWDIIFPFSTTPRHREAFLFLYVAAGFSPASFFFAFRISHFALRISHLVFCISRLKIPKLNQGDSNAFANRQGPHIPMSIQFHRWPPLPHPTHRQPSALLLLPRPKRIPIPVRREISQRAILFLLRRLPLRQRPKHRRRPPNPRHNPRPNQTPCSPHGRLHVPNPHTVHPPSPTRIH